ncbi:MAG TPA: DUF547 domain-containing protein [Elainellaceae cyanobacterium]
MIEGPLIVAVLMIAQHYRIFPGLVATVVLITGCSGIVSSTSNSQTTSTQTSPSSSEAFNYAPYADILATYINREGLVDYQSLQANPQKLNAFNTSIGEVSPDTYSSWDDAQKIAFLINAYNSFTLESIIDQDPLKSSIRDIPGVWRIRNFEIAGQRKTLDNIEHQTLRIEFNEPRIHAALVCAAISCPPLRPEPYRAETLDVQLDEQTDQWLSRPDIGFKIDLDTNQVYLSSIFEWFGEDWIPSYGVEDGFTGSEKERAVLNFISQYVSPEEREYLLGGNYDIRYLDYDWSLNIQSNLAFQVGE